MEAALVVACRDGSWGRYHGPHVCGLEAELADYFGTTHALTCASGTLAVEVALRAVGVRPGDEVVLAAYEYEANFLSIHAIGAKPVLVDVEPGKATLDPVHLPAAFSPRTRAVLVSHLHGTLADIRLVFSMCLERGVALVEDAAQCPGAVLEGRKAGSWGHAGVVSFGGSKLLAAGRGGAVFFRDPATYQRAKVWLSRGVQQWAAMSELQAAVLRPQLWRLDERTGQRWRAVQRIVGELGDVPGIRILGEPASSSNAGWVERVFERGPTGPANDSGPFDGSAPANPGLTQPAEPKNLPAYYKVGFHFDHAAFGVTRDEFCRLVRAEGVAIDPGFTALHLSRAPSRFRAVGDLPESTRLHDQCVVLHHPVLLGTNDQVAHVARTVRSAYRNQTRPPVST